MNRGLAAVDQHRDAAGWASRTTSFTGTIVPSAFDIWVIATGRVPIVGVRGFFKFINQGTPFINRATPT